MKVTQCLQFTHESEGRIYTATFPINSPLGECYDVSNRMCGEFLRQMQAIEQKKVEEVQQTHPEQKDN